MAKINRIKLELTRLRRTCDPAIRGKLLRKASAKLVKCLCNICVNALNNTQLKLGKKEKRLLTPYRKVCCALCRKAPLREKRKVLNQVGGSLFIPILLSTILPQIINGLFSK